MQSTNAEFLQHPPQSFKFSINSLKIKYIFYNAGFHQFHPMRMEILYQSIYCQIELCRAYRIYLDMSD